MKKKSIVWLVPGVLSSIAKSRGEKKTTGSGWTEILSEKLSDRQDIELTVFYPQSIKKEVVKGYIKGINYIGFYEPAIALLEYDLGLEECFRSELHVVKPDIVHIWGTEFVHTLCMVNAFDNPDKTVISIQGLISIIGKKYCLGLPENIINRHTFRDVLRNDSIAEQKEKFLIRGKYEIEAIKKVGHVIGRTDWDRDAICKINPDVKYHHCRELLRREFYCDRMWNYDECEKHSIFIAQAYYPVKGMHFAIEILRFLKNQYPDVRLYTTGKNVLSMSPKDIIKIDSYSKYIKDLIRHNDIEDNVCFLGNLSSSQMLERYLKSNAYLQTSLMENSPNSLGEAMILGVPSVASNVGGTCSMARNGESAFLFEYDDILGASNVISEIFDMKADVNRLCSEAIKQAKELYSEEEGLVEYLEVYNQM